MDHPKLLMHSFKEVYWAGSYAKHSRPLEIAVGEDITPGPSRSFPSHGVQKHVNKKFRATGINEMREMCTGLWEALQELICEDLQ